MSNLESSDQTEYALKAARRSLFIVLLMILVMGATLLSSVFLPDALLSRWPATAPWLIPVGGAILFAATGRQLRPNSPAMRAVLGDEWRRANLGRALRGAFIVVLIAQVPQAFPFLTLPTLRAVLGMAVLTITLGMTTVISLFLLFDRG